MKALYLIVLIFTLIFSWGMFIWAYFFQKDAHEALGWFVLNVLMANALRAESQYQKMRFML